MPIGWTESANSKLTGWVPRIDTAGSCNATPDHTALEGSTAVAAHPLGPQRAKRRHVRPPQISGLVHQALPRRGADGSHGARGGTK
eukprot:1931646-Pyramimonas_sp.AAC.1